MDVCADCGTRHDQALCCKIPKSEFYAGCDDAWVRRYYFESREGRSVTLKNRRDVIWVVPCETKVEQSVVFGYMRYAVGATYSSSFPGGLRKWLKVMKGYTPKTIVLATCVVQMAIDWVSQKDYYEVVESERDLMKWRIKYDPPEARHWDYSKTVPKQGHKRSNGKQLRLRPKNAQTKRVRTPRTRG